jgi:hypothetical protein
MAKAQRLHYAARVMNVDWPARFREVYDRGNQAWGEARKSPGAMFTREDTDFLATLGCTGQELFDFVDDFRRYSEPDFATALEVAAVRRQYFLEVLQGKSTGRTIDMNDLPAKTAAVDGIVWLPRLIEKARAKLRGEMPDDLMYGCGGDREFLRNKRVTLPAFLRLAWECGDDTRRIIDGFKRAAGLP